MRTFMRLLLTSLSCMLLFACEGRAAPTTGPGYVTLTPGLAELRDDFNAAAGDVRLVYIVDSTCPVCLRGMDDLGQRLAADRDDPRLRTFIIYVPALGSGAGDIAATESLVPGEHVSRYWDPAGESGRLYQRVLGISGFAWDMWMIYKPGQQWSSVPPKPDFWMAQLQGIPTSRYLDPTVFSRQVGTYLGQMKPARAP